MSFICQYCQKEFISKSNLYTHTNNAKYCIKLRNKSLNDSDLYFECKYCQKTLTSNQTLKKHLIKCEIIFNEKNKEIQELKNKVQEMVNNQLNNYQEQIKDLQIKLANKPTTINKNNDCNNNLYNNLQAVNLHPDHVKKVFDEKLSLQDIYKGKRGFIDFLVKNFLTDEKGNYIAWCPDHSRKMIKYVDENNEVIKDMEGYNLINNTSPVMESKSREITKEFKNTYYTYDENGRFTNKREDELSDESSYEDQDDEEDDEYDFSDFEEDEEKALERVKVKMLNKVSKILQEIKNYKRNYNPERIDFYFQKLVKSLEEFTEINHGAVNLTKDLIKTLPDKPKRKSKFAYDGEKTTKFDFDPEKI